MNVNTFIILIVRASRRLSSFNSYPNKLYFGSHWLTYRFANYDVPKYIGEFSFFSDKEEWHKWLNEFDERGFNWSIWSYKTISVGWWDMSWGIYVYKMNLKTFLKQTYFIILFVFLQ